MKVFSLYVWIDGSRTINLESYNVINTTNKDVLVQHIENTESIVLQDVEKDQLKMVAEGAEVSSFNVDDDFLGVYGTNIQLMKQQCLCLLLQMDLSDQRVISDLIALKV